MAKGHSSWFLQEITPEHDRSMDNPWMKMIYQQIFSIDQYVAWLARNHAIFELLENESKLNHVVLFDRRVHRLQQIEQDLQQLAGTSWRDRLTKVVQVSVATQRYLTHLREDSLCANRLIAHHWLQYNAVLNGGAYLGKMVADKFCLLPGAPGVAFYSFVGIDPDKVSAVVDESMHALDGCTLTEEERNDMLDCMRRIYMDVEDIMTEVFDLDPADGMSYRESRDADSVSPSRPLPPSPCDDQVDLSLAEMRQYIGVDGGRILLSIAGEILDVSKGSDLYGKGCSYSIFAGRDVSRCLGTMNFSEDAVDDLKWEPDDAEEEATLEQWRVKLKEKYPVAGKLKVVDVAEPEQTGLRKRNVQADTTDNADTTNVATDVAGDTQKCPISGKEGAGCPLSTFGVIKKPAKKKSSNDAFMGGKSLVASVESSSSEDWWLTRLCPLHWDNQTMKVVAVAAGISWCHGVFIGWFLHKQVAT